MSMPTLMDIAIANGSDMAVGLIEEVLTAAPEVQYGAARTIKGLNFKTLVRTALPTANFRNANEGAAPTKSGWENRLVECFILNPNWECDKAVADSYEDGREAYIALEADGQMRASMITLGKQFYYGALSGGDAKGHPGLLDAYDATNMVVDATGTTASTGSSVWAIKFGPQAVQWVYGNGGELMIEDAQTVRLTDADGNPYTGYRQELLARPGLQVASKYACARIKKLTEDSGKGLTDALLADLISKFPVGFRPDYLFMSRRSLKQLKKSRTATNETGKPAPTPVDYEGIPIVPTDSILDTESLTL